MEKFDLTTKEGKEKAKKFAMAQLAIFPPVLYFVFERIFNSDSIEKQAEAVEKIIEAGKKNGTDELEIKMKNTKGFKLNVPLEVVKIDTGIGSDEEMTLRVKYK